MYKANVLALSLLMSGCAITTQPTEVKEVSLEEEVSVEDTSVVKGSNHRDVTTIEQFDKLLAENELVVVDFYATWCGPCKAFASVFEQAISAFPNIMFVKVDGDQAEALMKRERVSSYPTIKVYKNGKFLEPYKGTRSNKAFNDYLSKLSA